MNYSFSNFSFASYASYLVLLLPKKDWEGLEANELGVQQEREKNILI